MSSTSSQRSAYAEFSVPALNGWVQAFWSSRAAGEARRILPDGCIDFIFNLDLGTARVVGTMTTSQLVVTPSGTHYFGVRFAPGAAASLIDTRADALCDDSGTLDEVGHAAAHRLCERVCEAPDDRARAQIIAAYLRDASSRRRPLDRRLHRATALLRQHHGALAIGELARQVGVSDRHLERLFMERVGTRPKLFARVLRMQRALALLEARPIAVATPALARALAAGFADEPHVVRDFRALTGLTPQALLRERHVGSVQPDAAALK
jgi:AraC-like DNA-binding protein